MKFILIFILTIYISKLKYKRKKRNLLLNNIMNMINPINQAINNNNNESLDEDNEVIKSLKIIKEKKLIREIYYLIDEVLKNLKHSEQLIKDNGIDLKLFVDKLLIHKENLNKKKSY